MKKVCIVYRSKTGITKRFAENICSYLNENDSTAKVFSIDNFDEAFYTEADSVLLGCWSGGLMIMLQHPDKEWIAFAKNIKGLENKKVGLFTTYKLATGSMFRKMKGHLNLSSYEVSELKSRNGKLNETHKVQLSKF